jgi:tRNA A-37 threonylcarbamoyl transferase component Bud32
LIAAGQSIGNYRILSKIGTGGMGAVYLAEHPLIGKRVALKVIHRELANNRDVVSRFFQEARAVNKIGNEHIVEIHDFGVTPEGDHFFIMEYLEGKTLASILSRERVLDVMRSLHVGAQIASAIAAAHAAGIIHRDLKPDNVMLMPRLGDQDFVKVLDFGLAKVFSAATAVKTAAGVLLGTPQYMSPEACESKGDVDHRTDIYALGVLLFQMMTGALPFDGDSMGEVLVKQVTALPPVPRALNPAIPPSVEQILLRCLAKRVDARFATMSQLREALLDPEAYLRGSPPIAPARSVGSDEGAIDAKTVMVQAAKLEHTRIATGMHVLPLPAPALTLSGQSAPTMISDAPGRAGPFRRASTAMPALAQPQEPKMNTMRIATPLGYSSRPPRKMWPLVLVIALLVGLGGGAVVVALGGQGEAVRSGDPAEVGAARGPADPGAGSGGSSGDVARSNPAPGSAASARADGSGASDASGALRTAAAGATSGSSAARIAAGATSGSSATAAGGATSGSQGAATGAGSGGRTTGSGQPRAPRTAHLSIDSVPPGAVVSGPEGEALGKTPIKLDWPISDLPVTFELRLAGYKKKQKQTVVNSNTALHIELERAPASRHPGNAPGSASTGSGGNGLMRPE